MRKTAMTLGLFALAAALVWFTPAAQTANPRDELSAFSPLDLVSSGPLSFPDGYDAH